MWSLTAALVGVDELLQEAVEEAMVRGVEDRGCGSHPDGTFRVISSAVSLYLGGMARTNKQKL